jgi:SAM-dependent methyltransferase
VVDGYHAIRTGVPFADMQLDVMHRLLDACGRPVYTLLDLGAGDGIATDVVAVRQPLTHAVLVDFSEPMLEAAWNRFAPGYAPFEVSLIPGDFRDAGWHEDVAASGPYDAVVLRFAIHHVPDEQKRFLYQAIFEWLAPGAMFINIEHVQSGSRLYADVHDQFMIDGIAAARGSADVDAVAESYRARADAEANILAPVHNQLEWLSDAGFVDVDCAFKVFELAVLAGRRPG